MTEGLVLVEEGCGVAMGTLEAISPEAVGPMGSVDLRLTQGR